MSTSALATFVLNPPERTIQYKNVIKEINDDYWETVIAPILSPNWDSPKDRLELFIYREENGSYLIQRSKYTKNLSTGEYKWVSYEFDPTAVYIDDVVRLFEAVKEKFFDYKDVSEKEYELAIQRRFARESALSWGKVKLVRKFLLQDSDWTQLLDNGIDDAERSLWIQYRQYLRDFLNLQQAETPYDVIFPITPKEYLARKTLDIPESITEAIGDQGVNADYLTSEYHFWKLSSNSLTAMQQRISVYIALQTMVETTGKYGRIDIKRFETQNSYTEDQRQSIIDARGEEGAQQYLDELIRRLEAGEI